MERRKFLHTIGLGALSLSVPLSLECSGFYSRKPNIVFILVDDLGWKDAGYMGSSFYETPNIDRLSKSGIVFTNAYSSAPNCAPTRASLLTGINTPGHGVYTVGSPERGRSENRKLIPTPNKTTLGKEFRIIPGYLKQEGYVTASIGKWHLGDDPDSGPLAHGFDMNIAGDRLGYPKSYFTPYKNENLPDGDDGEYLTDRLTTEAVKFIEENKENPFFLYLSHYAVHTPISAKKELTAKYGNKALKEGQNNSEYAAMIESVDESVGKVKQKLEELGLIDNTMIIFYSDNGGHGTITSNEPLRGSKGMLYEGGIRVPLAISWKGRIKANSICELPVISMDFLPTFLKMAGIKGDPGQKMDGQSLMPLLTGDGVFNRNELYWHFPAYLEGYTGMKDIWRTTPAGAIRSGKWKLIEFFEDGRLELYNLDNDIGETENLAEKYPEITIDLHNKLKSWRKKSGAPVPAEINPEYKPVRK
ncbi:sulfatase [candidate division KSB1 bacterium]